MAFLPDKAPGEKRPAGDYAVIGLADAPSGYALADSHVAGSASLGVETFHALSTLAHALFRCRLVSSFAQTPQCEAPTNEADNVRRPL